MRRKLVALMAAMLVCTISPEICMAETSAVEVMDTTKGAGIINVSVTAGSDISNDVNDALETAASVGTAEAPATVVIPAGSYTISKPLYLDSNIILKMEGVTLTYKGSDKNNLIVTGKTERNLTSANAGYNGYSNITIIGGTLISPKSNTGSMVKIAHAKNVTVNGLTLSGGGCAHQMEVCAIDGFQVIGCTFKDMKAEYDGDDKQEALQLDVPCAEEIYLNTYQDGTMMKNVTISNCMFSNVPRGVGTHTSLLGAYHENIVIKNNTFKDLDEEAIIGLNYYNCTITDNIINNCGGGILFQYFKANPEQTIYSSVSDGSYTSAIRYDAKTVISNNKITTKYNKNCDEIQGIKVYGNKLTKAKKGADGKKIPTGEYYISGVTVSGNTITTAGHGIHLSDAKKCTVTDNVITGKGFSSSDANRKKYDGIFFNDYSTDVIIRNNNIQSMARHGIFGMNGSGAEVIETNTIANCGEDGIGLYNNCAMSGDIKGNAITAPGGVGVMVSTKSKVKNIASNTIKKSKDTGITVYKNCTITGDISGNTIVDTAEKSHGMSITTSSKVKGKIANNTIKKASKKYSGTQGILVYNKSAVVGAITGNTIDKTVKNNISVTTGSKVGDITKNTLKNAGDNAILLYNNSTVKKIHKNKITGTKKRSIYISCLKNKLTISDNNISKGKHDGIVVETGTKKYKITIKGNTVKVPKNFYAIRAVSGNVSITKNTVSKKSLGIRIDGQAKGTAKNNKFK